MQVFKLLVDFGLVVLIWMTQLIVYPGFGYYSPEGLVQWHNKYTLAITIIVAPLMISQVMLHGWALFANAGVVSWMSILLILLIWINTFGFAVPIHHQISSGMNVTETVRKLVSINWYRTILWSMVFFITLYQTYLTQRS